MKRFLSDKKSILWAGLIAVLLMLAVLPLLTFAEGARTVPASDLPLADEETAAPTINLPSIYSNYMVLQRDKEIRIRGTLARNGVTLTGRLGEATASATVANGEWELVFPAMPASHNLTLNLTASDPDIHAKALTNIEVGEVWLACGQSNMELNLGSLPDVDEYMNNSKDYTNLRVFYRGNTAALTEGEILNGRWTTTADQSALKRSSAIGYVFLTELADAMPDVTVALVDANYPGTSIYSWLDTATLETYFPAKYTAYETACKENPSGLPANDARAIPSGCFNATIAPLAGISCRGILWYQGESDSGDPAGYEKAFSSYISLYRSFFRNPDLPFYTFQLAPYPSLNYVGFRMAQYDIAGTEKNVHLTATSFNGPTYSLYDNNRVSGGDFHVHPTCKAEPAIYCAREALAEEYGIGKDKVYKAPVLTSVTSSGKTVTLTFDTEPKLFFDQQPEGFYILTGSTRYPAKAEIVGKTIVLTSATSAPTGVLYAAEQICIECNDGSVLTGITKDVLGRNNAFTTITHDAGTYVFYPGKNEATRTTLGGNITNASGAPLPSFCVNMSGESVLLP